MCNKILVPYLGTMAVMEYADAHPDFVFNKTCFIDGHGHSLVASEYHPDEAFLSLDEDGAYIWHTTPDGWQRVYAYCGWVCRKNGRYIFITN